MLVHLTFKTIGVRKILYKWLDIVTKISSPTKKKKKKLWTFRSVHITKRKNKEKCIKKHGTFYFYSLTANPKTHTLLSVLLWNKSYKEAAS